MRTSVSRKGSRIEALIAFSLPLVACAALAVGCDGAETGTTSEDVGVVELALVAPAGVGSVSMEFVGASRSVARCVPVDGTPTTRLAGLPTGAVTVSAAAYPGPTCQGDVSWFAEPVSVTLVAGRPVPIQIAFRPNGIAVIGTTFIDDAPAPLVNLAVNPSCVGFPSPAESDSGWGGGSNKCEIVDGLRSYDIWSHGLAFTGGHQTAAGGPPWIEAAGVRHAVIDFGVARTFQKVIVWQHGTEHTPETATVEYWDGTQWITVGGVQREYGTMHEEGTNSGYSDSDIYTFAPVTGSRVRYSFDNSGNNITGTLNVHGWIYEVEVFGTAR
jgi:hypothetical protein